MADELSITLQAWFSKNSVSASFTSVLASLFDVAGNQSSVLDQLATTTPAAINLGACGTTGGTLIVWHTGKDSSGTDTTDTVTIKTSSSGTNFATLGPGMPMLLPLYTGGANAPYITASANTVMCKVWMVEA